MRAVTNQADDASLEDGRYRLRDRLGTGGMSSVWLAEDHRLDRLVAVKLMSEVLASDPRCVERFDREARIAAGLSHPHLVKVYDVGSEETRPFLVMEYIAGGTLEDRLRSSKQGSLDVEALARQLLDALAHIHEAGIVHRDVKPANILIGSDGRARLTDFGIAQSEEATRLTQTGEVVGTLKFLAPEVARGGPATARSDLYSLGITLSELVGDDASRQLRSLIGRLTAADPTRRPASAGQALGFLNGRLLTTPSEEQATAALITQPTAPLDGGASAAPTEVVVHDDPAEAAPLAGRAPQMPTLRVDRRLALVGMAIVALVILIAVLSDSGSVSPVFRPRAPSSSAPLSRQLDFLDRTVERATHR